MPRNPKRENPYDKVIQIALPDGFAEDLETYCVSQDEVLLWADEVVQEGYSLQMSYDTERKNFTARMFGSRTEILNRGQALYANGPSVFMALNVLRFKHLSVGTDVGWETKATNTYGDYS